MLTYENRGLAQAALARLKHDSQVLWVGENEVLSFSSAPVVPNDRYFSQDPNHPASGNFQWGMQALNLPAAWAKVRGNAYLGDIDSGIHEDCSSGTCVPHVDLRRNFRQQFSRQFFLGNGYSNDVKDSTGHGTHVAGIMVASPEYGAISNGSANSGVTGVCWSCSLAELLAVSFDTFHAGMTYAVDHGLQAFNMSFGDQRKPPGARFDSCAQGDYQLTCVAIEHAKQRDVVMVASAGNWRENRVAFPARHPDVIGVGGLQLSESGPVYWLRGYPDRCAGDAKEEECGSNYGPELAVMAPAMDIVSTVIPGKVSAPDIHCGDSFGPDLDLPGGDSDGYGDFTGTSMSAPHITGLVGLIRSINPLLSRNQVRSILVQSSHPCTGPYSERCNGAGIPDAAVAVTAALGGHKVVNRLTPLFGFYTSPDTNTATLSDHFYTTVPQMAMSAMIAGQLLPQPAAAGSLGYEVSYSAIGVLVPGYQNFPDCDPDFGGCMPPTAIASVFSTHVNPIPGEPELVPLYRYSWACSEPGCKHVSHGYTTALNNGFATHGYQLDGIEGYIYPKTQNQPSGTVKLCRKYDESRDDYILFPGQGTDCSATTDGYTTGNYNQLVGGTDWIGWVYPVSSPQFICSRGVPCSKLPNPITMLLLLLLDSEE